MTSVELDPETKAARKAELVEALRSGQYPQAYNALKKSEYSPETGGQHGIWCCLGVACEVYAKHEDLKIVYREGQWEFGEAPSTTYPPSNVKEWYGWETEDPRIEIPGGFKPLSAWESRNDWISGQRVGRTSLAAINDSRQFTPAQIGDIIDYFL